MTPPPFYRTNPTVWFRQMESQFVSHQFQKTSQSTCQWKLKTTAASKIASLKPTRSQKRNSSKKHWEQFHWTDKSPQFASCASSASFRMSSDNGQRCNQAPPHASHAYLNAFLTFRTFGPATRQIRQTSRHHIQLPERHISGKHARSRYTAILVIVVCTPAAAKAKKQPNRQQSPAVPTRTTTENLPLSLVFR